MTPVTLLAWLAVATSPEPVIYSQSRCGDTMMSAYVGCAFPVRTDPVVAQIHMATWLQREMQRQGTHWDANERPFKVVFLGTPDQRFYWLHYSPPNWNEPLRWPWDRPKPKGWLE